ncbi:GNAT family N-acetyltransferase [Aureimonas pseudogalii]|uniref:GNAT superfamily N-acetyltransferase n=1 Tax=Aureimonas pseudogalii TaxID=1744844 RepID=A0A7W6MLN6_9HYPH|nr:GNAT family N-acetyltransferase [Aureimonas pseudogalii]MBB3999972.1 GNAT superfamily N-acetyltransferase [Aureimonas pseudogalii]
MQFVAAHASGSSPALGLVRALRVGDRADVAAHLLRLDTASRRQRFAGSVGAAFVERYARTVADPNAHARGLFVDGVLRGLGELRFFGPSCVEAEMAFSIEADWRGQGAGSRLFASLVDAAANRGAAHLVLHCQGDNSRMLRIARRHGAALTTEGGEVVARLCCAPSEASAAREAAEERVWRIAMAACRGVYRLAIEAGIDLRHRAT